MATPTSTTLLAVRHGETAWNVDGRIQGQRDVPLNAAGRAQAMQVAQALVGGGGGVDALVASDLRRAVETAQQIGGVCKLPLSIDSALRERAFGAFEGFLGSEIAERWPLENALWHRRDPDAAPPEGESLRAFSTRCVDAVSRIAAAHVGKTVVVVVHGGVLDCLYRAATGIALEAPRTWPLANAAINRLRWHAGKLEVVDWGDTAHVRGARDEPVDAAAVAARAGRG